MGKRLVKRYHEEFRKSSAKLAVESDLSLTKTAEALGVNTMTLHGWVHKYYPHDKAIKKISSNDLETQNKRLRKELARAS